MSQNAPLFNKVTVDSHTKSTLDIDNINILQTKEKIIEYYRFLESFDSVAAYAISDKFRFTTSVPNTAVPQPITKEVGEKFANLCRLCYEIETSDEFHNLLTYFSSIIPYGRCTEPDKCRFCNDGHCGQGKSIFGLLPNNTVSLCHDGFIEMANNKSVGG